MDKWTPRLCFCNHSQIHRAMDARTDHPRYQHVRFNHAIHSVCLRSRFVLFTSIGAKQAYMLGPDCKLSWSKHIDSMVVETGRGLSVVKRCSACLTPHKAGPAGSSFIFS